MTLRGQVGLLLVAVSVLIGSALVATGAVSNSVEQLTAAADRARALEHRVDDLLSALGEAESSQRLYLLAGRPDDLRAYQEAESRVGPLLQQLAESAASTDWLRPDAERLSVLVQHQFAAFAATQRRADREGLAAARQSVLADVSLQEMRETTALGDSIVARAELEQTGRAAKLQARQRLISIASLVSLLGALVLLATAGLRMLWIRAALHRARAGEQREAERLAAAVEHIRDGVAVFDRHDRLVLQNTRFAAVLGRSAPVPRHTTFAEVAAGTPLASPVLAGPAPEGEPVVIEARQADCTLEIWRSAMPDGGQIVAVSDITRRVEAEAIARRSQKMDTLGQMTGGIAHDFNNLLQVISGNLELVAERLARSGDAQVLERLAAASAGVASGAQLTRHLLAFARRQPLAPEALDPGRFLHTVEDMLRRSLGEGVELRFEVAEELWPMRADPGQMESALLNLTLNARDAMVGADGYPSGRVTIAIENATVSEAAEDGPEPGDYVVFSVTDTGIGMTSEQLGRAFEPFYTTKPDGKGTGLGLPMVFGFAKQSGGVVQLASQPGRGTTARLFLPRTASRADPAPEAALGQTGGRGELVLVVEDDRSVREVACSSLGALGYAVREAGSADEALALLQGGLRPSALFTDVVMPGEIGALELAAEARAMFPDLAVLFTTGYAGDARVQDPLEPGMALLPKPWRSDELARALRGALLAARYPGRRRPRRILLVEDEPSIRETVAEVLAGLGFEVVEAEDAAGGLARLDPAPDLLLTDLGLPDMDGLELVRRVRQALPLLPVVVATGRLDRAPEDLVLLTKPFDGRQLRQALAAALRQPEMAS